MQGYRNRPQETAEALRDGWLYTGDIGELDADGYLYIRGRKKDMVIVGGYNVYPREVEEVLCSHPAVRRGGGGRRAGCLPRRVPACLRRAAERKSHHEDAAVLLRERLARYKIRRRSRCSRRCRRPRSDKLDKLPLKARWTRS